MIRSRLTEWNQILTSDNPKKDSIAVALHFCANVPLSGPELYLRSSNVCEDFLMILYGLPEVTLGNSDIH
ncbi:hypothetical protein RRG08_052506 [Elysia crispata]|uniref:Uncharacterized protein n=1 Tax=Elysia crispata TaxID=231223 RepID=A0AAE0ZIT3_9GAST|nr:hypothetical protein RRG08_052506 [Elysia crispata]